MRDFTIGAGDGIAIPLALVAGLSAATDSNNVIVMAGITAATAGSIAMGVSGYFSRQEDGHDHHEDKKTVHGGNDPLSPEGIVEAKHFFANLGLSKELQSQAAAEIAKDRKKWEEVMVKYESLRTDQASARSSGLSIAISYLIAGFIPLSPYFFIGEPIEAFKYSAVISLIFLFALGWIKGKVTGINPFASAMRLTLISALAAAAIFFVARIFISA